MAKEFVKELDQAWSKLKEKGIDPTIDQLAAYHNARATICLYDEVYTVRTAVNASSGAINSTKNAVVGTQQAIGYVGDKCIELKGAIDKASEQSTSLGKKLFYLNCILTIATALATAFAVISFFTGTANPTQ